MSFNSAVYASLSSSEFKRHRLIRAEISACRCELVVSGGRSSVGRATALQAVGRRFEPVRLHQIYLDLGDYQVWASSSVG